jgi:DNA polymerase sigma
VAVLIDELIGALRPTPASDRRRRAVFQHVADLINGCFENENVLVTAFGSVPLRTYLPDGDIDVCLLGPHELLAADPCWTSRLRDHIEFAEADAAAHDAVSPFAVSEIHVVHAEVRLMKCICDGVVVDISANQFGGLATLGFLEEVDAFVSARLKSEGLFKRSIVLIKAWGFYEGRLLGAHHALISTYALETLVLYVLNKFHRSKALTTPLETR